VRRGVLGLWTPRADTPQAAPGGGGRNESPGVPPWPVWGGWTPPSVLRDAGPEVGGMWGKPPVL